MLTTAESAITLRHVELTPSPSQRLAEVLLGTDLAEWVAERRDPEVRRSWRVIANELRRITDGQVDVTGEAVRQWYGHVDARFTEPAAS